MSDDADPTYSASTNQMAEGHKWIFNTFGVTPRYGWHIGTLGTYTLSPVPSSRPIPSHPPLPAPRPPLLSAVLNLARSTPPFSPRSWSHPQILSGCRRTTRRCTPRWASTPT